MPASDIQITITADASGMKSAIQEAKAAVDDFARSSEALGRPLGDLATRLRSPMRELKTAMDGLVSTFSRGLAQMVMGARSFGQVMRSLGLQILDDMLKVVDGMVEKWAWGVTEKILASTQGQAALNALGQRTLASEIANVNASRAAAVAGAQASTAAREAGAAKSIAISGQSGMKEIVNAAAQAAGNAYNAMAGIPVVGPVLGAAAAASVFAAVMAFKGLISSAAGGFDVPAGVNPLTQLHAQEMVLPARIANPMRAMIDDYAASRDGPGGGTASGGGDTHIHNYSVSALDAASFRTFLRGNKDPLSTVLQEMGRAGMKTS